MKTKKPSPIFLILAVIPLLAFPPTGFGSVQDPDTSSPDPRNSHDNPRAERRFGIGIQLGGPTMICSAQIDYFITPRINIEAGAGLVGYYSGVKFHLSQSSWSPYLGAKVTFLPELKLFGGSSMNPGLYAPFGIQYMNREGFTFAFEAALLLTDSISWAIEPIWAGVKFGYHF